MSSRGYSKMMIELSLDLGDIEEDIKNKEILEKENKVQEIKKNEYYKNLSNIYIERLQLILTNEKS